MPTALITGASQGIGEAFARRLAATGHDLVLVARNREALEGIAADLRGAGRDVEVLAADLTDGAELPRVEGRLADAARPVDVLVNNAGFGTTGRFHELPRDGEDREIRLNVLALTRLAHAALPAMVARRAGGVINVASVAAFQPVPGNATYAATKAFVLSFSLALHEEYRRLGVTVLCVCPGSTDTEWHARAGYNRSSIPGFAHQSAEACVDEALAAFARRRALVTTNWPNKILGATTHLSPRVLLARISGRVSGQV